VHACLFQHSQKPGCGISLGAHQWGILLSHKEEQNEVICRKMDGTGVTML
jgi:hypothetical protein